MKHLIDTLGIKAPPRERLKRDGIFHSNAGDFTAQPVVGTNEILITGLPFTLEAQLIHHIHITGNGTWRSAEPNYTVWENLITLNSEPPFTSGENVFVHLTEPNKSWQ